MQRYWAAAPRSLRVLAVLGTVWFVLGMLLGVPLLVLPGPGLLVMMLGAVGIVPWIVILARGSDDTT